MDRICKETGSGDRPGDQTVVAGTGHSGRINHLGQAACGKIRSADGAVLRDDAYELSDIFILEAAHRRAWSTYGGNQQEAAGAEQRRLSQERYGGTVSDPGE